MPEVDASCCPKRNCKRTHKPEKYSKLAEYYYDEDSLCTVARGLTCEVSPTSLQRSYTMLLFE